MPALLKWKISFWLNFRHRMAEQRPSDFDIYLLVFEIPFGF